jgi:Coenzyme PQQ synthesis protein D (PqqD)
VTSPPPTPPTALRCSTNTGRYWQLNHTGTQVLHALLEDTHPDRIAHELTTRYGLEPDQARRDVDIVTAQLTTANLLIPA